MGVAQTKRERTTEDKHSSTLVQQTNEASFLSKQRNCFDVVAFDTERTPDIRFVDVSKRPQDLFQSKKMVLMLLSQAQKRPPVFFPKKKF